ncbi:MAG: response regulator [Spirochaetaceae bacterium]|nr:MAG: response regulator [Spirochaetaceae bacterium]
MSFKISSRKSRISKKVSQTREEQDGPVKIFIVDDEAIIAQSLALDLKQRGFEARAVRSGEACIELIGKGDVPDLILMDLNLGTGRFDGPAATRAIQEVCDVPVVLHTAYTDSETLQSTHEMLRYGYVHKVPGNVEFIVATIKMALKLHGTEKRLRERERMYRDLSSHLQSVREDQNAIIAREIHDDLGQSLTALKMNLNLVRRRTTETVAAGESSDLPAVFEDMESILNTTVRKVRSMIEVLRPPLLDTTGIVDALHVLVSSVERELRIPVRLHVPSDPLVLDGTRSLVLYRVVQEALTNCARHAEPRSIAVTVDVTDDAFVAVIEDDGRGFDPAAPRPEKRFGIVGMRERVEHVGGEMSVQSSPGKGTLVRVVIPREDAQ